MSGNNNTITAADAIITLTVNNLYPSGVQLQRFAADNVYGTDPLVLAETVRGIDGKLSAGFVYSNIIQTFHIMPDSPSRAVFRCNAVVLLPAIGRKYTCVNGVLKQWKALPDAARTLQPGQAVIEWETITPEVFN
ncbi:hypothetical protein EAA80_17680 [Salmonella enterica]|nr:hypothetical protein [Salmonella enterica]EBN5253363.1 hypothetical protein [Salmonella enterica]ECU9626365.1 hypothetical protein [Salmonella enterica]